MTELIRVKDLFELPEQIRKGDFVLKLSDGVNHPRETAMTYVVTPALAESMDQALRLIGSALRDRRSQAAYVHGSFGSGKSHFMALVSLLAAGNEDAWRIPALHPLREKHGYVGTARLLELHLHMIGQQSLEAAIFGRYLSHLHKVHPEAPLPGLFADEQLFEDARRMLGELGEDKFFAPMNASASAAAGWGSFGAACLWTAERFEQATRSVDPGERAELFSALVKTRFTSYAAESHKFIDLDQGLSVVSRHAAALGYEAVVLFLDELILWLASRASDAAWLHVEAQKMVKLVEAQNAERPVPFISFIARQRDLSEMVGEEYAGAENARLRQSLDWWEGRYDKIVLEDRNLPAIAEKRVLRPKSEQARQTLSDALATMRKTAGNAWQTMLGTQDGEAFRKLYPFSPALVEALVALSNSLQRERTAIKLLTELLVEHIEELPLGEVVRVGDLFDPLAGGEDTADGVMKSRFESAKQLYKYQLLPLVQRANGTTGEDRCQRLRDDHPTRLGCSNCEEKGCRTDNRLIKTLLIAALVPEVPALREMTAGKLAALNYGSLKVPVQGTEARLVAEKLRRLSSEVAQLQVGEQSDPTVRVQLEGVDLKPVLAQAAQYDTPGARQRVLRDLLFDVLGVSKVLENKREHAVTWRSTTRIGEIVFGNVRTMRPEQLRCRDDHDWRLVIDYPFDEGSFGPNDDLAVAERARDDADGTWTLVWLPSFFSAAVNRLLGELVVLEHMLETKETTRSYVASLSVENQSRAILDLENLRNSKKARLSQVLEQAYGLSPAKEGDLDPSHCLDVHLHALKAGAELRPSIGPRFGDALDNYIPALLSARYPRHPAFTRPLGAKSAARVERLLEWFAQIVDAPDKRIPADRDQVEEMRGTLAELGLVRVTENAVHLLEDRMLQDIERRRQQRSVDHPQAGQVRSWIDETGTLGLQSEVLDLVVRAYARWSCRTLVHFDRPHEPKVGRTIPDDVVLLRPELPSQSTWNAALDMAGSSLGIALPGKALHADNLKRFEVALAEKLRPLVAPSAALPPLLERWIADFGDLATAERLRTARSGDDFVKALLVPTVTEQIDVLASFPAQTSPRAMGKSLATAQATVELLEDELVRGVFHQLAALPPAKKEAQDILRTLSDALRQDELHCSLAARARGLAKDGQRLLIVQPPLPPTRLTTQVRRQIQGASRAEALSALAAVVSEVEAKLPEMDGTQDIDVQVTITRSPR
jgi:hypothetical protein